MAANFLKINVGKSELVLIGNYVRFIKITDCELSVGDVKVKPPR